MQNPFCVESQKLWSSEILCIRGEGRKERKLSFFESKKNFKVDRNGGREFIVLVTASQQPDV